MPRYDPADPNADFSQENLQRLIETMSDWSAKRPWTTEQTAAWRLRWFGRTPAEDATAREEAEIARYERQRSGFDDYRDEREPFNDWPNNMGTYD
jgi:hypothetical protein